MEIWKSGILILAFYLIVEAKPGDKCNHLLKFDLMGADNRVLRDFVFHHTNTASRVTCARDCVMESGCLSVNFFENENLCELNNATRLHFPEKFDQLQGSFYFDYDSSTTRLDDSDDEQTVPPSEFASCKDLQSSATDRIASGVYTIFPGNPITSDGLRVYCDMETDGGGWIVFQRRQDGSVDFYRSWAIYQAGFGNLSGEFWLGNDNLRALTEASSSGGVTWELRIDMADWSGGTAWAEYTEFSIAGMEYILHVGGFNSESTAGDSLLSTHNGQPFSTPDRDNDDNFLSCSQLNGGAWWYENCHDSSLNGVYNTVPKVVYNQGIQWESWKGNSYSLKRCSMMIREIS